MLIVHTRLAWLMVFNLLLLSGCGTAATSAPSSTPATATETPPLATPTTDTETDPEVPMQAEFDPNSPLFVTTRDTFRICLDVSEKADATQVTEQLQAALAQVRQHPDWDAVYGSSQGVPTLEPCELELPDKQLARAPMVGPGLTENPGPYRTVLAVLDADQAEQTLGERSALYASYEAMAVSNGAEPSQGAPEQHDQLVPVTSIVIVREDFLQDPEFVDWYLTLAVALNPQLERRHGEEDPDATE